MTHVIVVIGAGQIGPAIARRVGVGKHIVLADVRAENAEAAARCSAKPAVTSAPQPAQVIAV